MKRLPDRLRETYSYLSLSARMGANHIVLHNPGMQLTDCTHFSWMAIDEFSRIGEDMYPQIIGRFKRAVEPTPDAHVRDVEHLDRMLKSNKPWKHCPNMLCKRVGKCMTSNCKVW